MAGYSLENRITQEVMPTINEVKRWKITGVTVLAMVGMAGLAGAAFASVFIWGWDVIVSKWNGG